MLPFGITQRITFGIQSFTLRVLYEVIVKGCPRVGLEAGSRDAETRLCSAAADQR